MRVHLRRRNRTSSDTLPGVDFLLPLECLFLCNWRAGGRIDGADPLVYCNSITKLVNSYIFFLSVLPSKGYLFSYHYHSVRGRQLGWRITDLLMWRLFTISFYNDDDDDDDDWVTDKPASQPFGTCWDNNSWKRAFAWSRAHNKRTNERETDGRTTCP